MNMEKSQNPKKILPPDFITKQIVLKSDQEYRIQVPPETYMEVDLIEGTAEIFGSEMTTFKTYTFESNKKLAIYTYQGCKINVSSIKHALESCYEWECSDSEENPMIAYLNSHYYVNQLREDALINDKIGPKIMICGSSSSGKKTLSKIFCNYAGKTGWKPIFVDLDIIMNEIGTSGCLGSAVISEGYPDLPDGFLELSNKILFWNGHLNYAQKNFYQEQVKSLASAVLEKLQKNLNMHTEKFKDKKYDNEIYKELNAKTEKNIFASGCIIKTPTYTEELGLNTFKMMVENFEVDVVFVIDHDGLFNKLKKECPNKAVIKLNKSGGVVEINEKQKIKIREAKFLHYFEGLYKQIKSQIIVIPYSKVFIYAITKSPIANYALPAGTTPEEIDRLRTKKIDPSNENLTKKVLGVVHLKIDIENSDFDNKLVEKLIRAPLNCLAYVKEINPNKKEMTVSFPFLGVEDSSALKNYWLFSDITWMG